MRRGTSTFWSGATLASLSSSARPPTRLMKQASAGVIPRTSPRSSSVRSPMRHRSSRLPKSSSISESRPMSLRNRTSAERLPLLPPSLSIKRIEGCSRSTRFGMKDDRAPCQVRRNCRGNKVGTRCERCGLLVCPSSSPVRRQALFSVSRRDERRQNVTFT